MLIEFANHDLERLYTDAGFTGGFAKEIVKLFRRRIDQVIAAADERDFRSLKSLHYEKLQGKRAHQRSMRLNDKWRLILEIDQTGRVKIVVICAIEDYR